MKTIEQHIREKPSGLEATLELLEDIVINGDICLEHDSDRNFYKEFLSGLQTKFIIKERDKKKFYSKYKDALSPREAVNFKPWEVSNVIGALTGIYDRNSDEGEKLMIKYYSGHIDRVEKIYNKILRCSREWTKKTASYRPTSAMYRGDKKFYSARANWLRGSYENAEKYLQSILEKMKMEDKK